MEAGVPTTGDPQRTTRDLGAGRGRKGGGKRMLDTAEESIMRCGVQRLEAENGGWRVGNKYRWTTYRSERGCGEQVI